MRVIVVGATGRTGQLVVAELLAREVHVNAIVRSKQKLSANVTSHPYLTVTEASILDLSETSLQEHLQDCDAVISCLGHVGIWGGIKGTPPFLVYTACQRLCNVIQQLRPPSRVRYIIMTADGVVNPDKSDGERSRFESGMLWLITKLVHSIKDNQAAADYLHKEIGTHNPYLEWCVVRPSDLIETSETSPYNVIAVSNGTAFDAAFHSRISNVAHFMCDLATRDEVWNRWVFHMPVVLDSDVNDAVTLPQVTDMVED